MAFRKLNIQNTVTTEVDITDNIIILGKDNISPSTDIGFLGKTASNNYSGLIRDGQTNEFYLIDAYNSLANNDVNPNQISSLGVLNVFEVNASTINAQSFTRLRAPSGNELQRPVDPVPGEIFFNTDQNLFEGYDGTEWIVLIPATLAQE